MCDFTVENGVLTKYTGSSQEIVIPDGITAIGDSAFYSCPFITKVVLTNHVSEIGDSAFSDCAGLTYVVIPNSVRSLGSYAFYDCTRLLRVKIPESVTSIGRETFSGCTRLTSVTIPKSITVIEQMAFAFCPLITNVYYLGAEADWENIEIHPYNENLTNAPRYYYSEEKPLCDGNYWHYEDNLPVVWQNHI